MLMSLCQNAVLHQDCVNMESVLCVMAGGCTGKVKQITKVSVS